MDEGQPDIGSLMEEAKRKVDEFLDKHPYDPWRLEEDHKEKDVLCISPGDPWGLNEDHDEKHALRYRYKGR